MRPLSIRTQIAVYSASLTAVAIAVFAAGTLVSVYQEQIEAADLEIEAVGRRMGEMRNVTVSLVGQTVEKEAGFEPWISTAVFDEHGQLHLLTGGMPEVVARAAVVTRMTHTVGDGPGAHRVATFPLGPELLVVAYDLKEVHDTVAEMLSAYLLSLPFVAAIIGFGASFLAKRALQPLRALRTTAAAITSERLDSRVMVPPRDDEVSRLAIVLNTMLARLEASFRQAERFAADASHELRTPLTVMRCEIDRALHAPGLPAAVEQQMVSLQQEVARLERICENLLLLAKFDARHVQIGRVPVDFSALVRDACEDAGLLGAARRVRVESDIAAGITVPGDADLLRRVLLNLADNAVKFNMVDGAVRCRLHSEGQMAVCTVANTGAGVPAEDRGQVFKRFYRADTARASGGGHGLGLSLAHEIAGAHGGSLVLAEQSAPGWTEFVLTLPLVR